MHGLYCYRPLNNFPFTSVHISRLFLLPPQGGHAFQARFSQVFLRPDSYHVLHELNRNVLLMRSLISLYYLSFFSPRFLINLIVFRLELPFFIPSILSTSRDIAKLRRECRCFRKREKKGEENREEEKRAAIKQIRLWHVPFVSIGNSSPHNTSFLLTIRNRSNPIPRSYPRAPTIGPIYTKQMGVNRKWPTFFERWFDHDRAKGKRKEGKGEKEDFVPWDDRIGVKMNGLAREEEDI